MDFFDLCVFLQRIVDLLDILIDFFLDAFCSLRVFQSVDGFFNKPKRWCHTTD